MLARSTTSGNYEATVILSDTTPGATAGIAAIGDNGNAAGLAMREGKLMLWRRDKGKHQVLEEVSAPAKKSVHLRVVGSEGHDFAFAFSADGKNWSPVGKAQRGDDFPPWDRSIRVGLTTGGVSGAKATFEQFRLKSQPGKNN
jgi:hypothetical protein